MDESNVTLSNSSRSSSNGVCVQVGAGWRKSSYSGSNGGGCVEVKRPVAAVVSVRDSKDPRGPVLSFPAAAWRDFTAGLKSGDLDPG